MDVYLADGTTLATIGTVGYVAEGDSLLYKCKSGFYFKTSQSKISVSTACVKDDSTGQFSFSDPDTGNADPCVDQVECPTAAAVLVDSVNMESTLVGGNTYNNDDNFRWVLWAAR